MSRFTGELTITQLDADYRTWRLEQDLVYEVGAEGSGREIRVPMRFETDGASIPRLLQSFAKAEDEAARARVAAEIQTVAYELTPAVMWGQFTIPAGYRTTLKNIVPSSYPIFWGVELAA